MMKKLYLILGIAFMISGAVAPAVHAMPEPYVQEAEVKTVELKVNGHQLNITNHDNEAKQVVIYALTGQVVKQFDAPHGTTAVDLGAGYYIVKIEKLSQRIVIR